MQECPNADVFRQRFFSKPSVPHRGCRLKGGGLTTCVKAEIDQPMCQPVLYWTVAFSIT